MLNEAETQMQRLLRRSMELNRLKRLPAYWLSRAIVALEVLTTIVVVSWFEEASLTAQAIESAGRAGWGLILGLFACCVVALVDVVINDLLPERFTFMSGLHFRHIGFLGMSILLASIAMLVTFQLGFTTLVVVYWTNAGLAAVIAYLDIFTRLRQ